MGNSEGFIGGGRAGSLDGGTGVAALTLGTNATSPDPITTLRNIYNLKQNNTYCKEVQQNEINKYMDKILSFYNVYLWRDIIIELVT